MPGDPRAVLRYATAGAAAIADGVVAAALELTAEHLRTRRPVRQAAGELPGRRAGDRRGLHHRPHGEPGRDLGGLAPRKPGCDATDDLEVAAYWLAAELPRALQTCHHLHGGLGVDITYPLHRYYSHAKDLARLVGGAAARLETIGALCSSS